MNNEIVFEHFEEISSTNDVLKARIAAGDLDSVVCLSADRQTNGRGRRGRSWLNTDGALMVSIACSLSGIDSTDWPLLSMAIALGVHDALSEHLPECSIKWPNDIVVFRDDELKKLCGILTEIAVDPSGKHFAVIGIGVNANCPSIPSDLMQPATSIFLETGKQVDTQELKKRVAERVMSRVVWQGKSLRCQLEEYSERCVTIGHLVSASDLSGNVVAEGRASGILPDGRLVIETPSGEKHIDACDVSVRSKRA